MKRCFSGIKVIFRSALVVLKLALGNPDDLKQLTGVHETAAYIKNYKLKDIDPDIWIKQVRFSRSHYSRISV